MKFSLAGISILGILISQSVLAQELQKNSVNTGVDNAQINKEESKTKEIVESEIYDITINNNWQFSSLTHIDSSVIYIPAKFIPSEMLGNLNNNLLVDYKGSPSLKVDKSSIVKNNIEELSLVINLGENYFKSQLVTVDKDSGTISEPINALFLNYNTNIDPSEINGMKATIDANWASKNGSILRNYFYADKESLIRLNTTWKKKLKNNDILSLGDVYNHSSSGFGSLNFLGARYSTPYYSNLTAFQDSLPTIPISGFAVNPTKLDLYINNQVVQSKEINSGKYNIDVPYQTGGYGVAQAYIYDITGKPTIISVPFYGSTEMIKKGTNEYDFSGGFIRKNYGSKSFDYSSPVVSATYKKGVTDNYTQDYYAQISPIYSVISSLSHWVVSPKIGMLNIGASVNSNRQALLRLGMDHSSSRISFGVDYQRALKDSFCLGFDQACLVDQIQASTGFQLPKKAGVISLNYIQKKDDKESNKITSIQWSKQLTTSINLNASYADSKSTGAIKENKSLYAGLSFSFGGKYSGNSTYSHDRNGSNLRQSFNSNEDSAHPERGYGSLTFNKRDDGQTANLFYGANLSKFSYQTNLYKDKETTTGSISIAGGMTYIPEDKYFTFNRQIDSGLTYVNIENTNIPINVSSQNKVIGKTNSKGQLIVPDALPLGTHNIELDVNKLPNDITLEEYKKSFIVPYSGVSKVKFRSKLMPYLIKINGVKAGAIFSVNKEYYVVGEQGLTSVESEGKAVLPMDDGKTCQLDIVKAQKEYSCQ